MPAAPAIAPLPGTIAVKTTSAPAVPAPAEGFGQVLRSVCGASTGVTPVPAANNADQGQPAPVDPDPTAAAIEGTIAGQVAAAAPAALGKGGATPPTPQVAKSEHSGKGDHRAAKPDATTPDPTAALAPETVVVPAVAPNQAADPQPVTTPSGATPVSVSGDPPVPVRAAPTTTGLDAGGTAVRGGVRSRAEKGPVTREKPDQAASSAPVAATTPTEPAAVVQTQTQSVDAPAPAADTTTQPAHPASTTPG